MRWLWLWAVVGWACATGPRAVGAPEPTPVLIDHAESEPGALVTQETAAPASRPDARAAPVASSADESLGLAVYEAAGVPASNRRWSPEDYAQAQRALGRLSRANRLFLPRSQSSRSGELFARLVNPENLDPLEDGSLELEARWDLVQQHAGAIPALLGLYAFATNDDAAFPREQVALVAHLLRVHSRALIMSTQGELADGERARDLERTALAVLAGAARLLGESQRYDLSDRLVLAQEMVRERALLESRLRGQDLMNLRGLFGAVSEQVADERLRQILRDPEIVLESENARR